MSETVQSIGAPVSTPYVQANSYDSAYPVENAYAIPEYEEVPESKGSSGTGKVLATVAFLALLGLGGWGCHRLGASSYKKELTELKNSEAVKNYEGLKATFDGMSEAVEKIEKDADKVIDSTFGGWQYGKDFARDVKEKITTPFKDAKSKIEKAAKEAEDEAGEAAEEAADAVANAIA